MNSSPKSIWNPARLDVRAFALAGQWLQKVSPLADFERLSEEALPDGSANVSVAWQLVGEIRADARGKAVPWLHLEARAEVPLKCQRCLGPVSESLVVDRWYRFVADEATAELEDEDSEEDVLALEPRPDMVQLVEDELLMSLPLVALHDACPVDVPMQAGHLEITDAPEALRESPFAQLARLKK